MRESRQSDVLIAVVDDDPSVQGGLFQPQAINQVRERHCRENAKRKKLAREVSATRSSGPE